MKLKKATALLFAALLAFVPLSAQATTESEIQFEDSVIEQVEEKALVIIDSYFDSSKISGEVVNVCVATRGCELSPTPVAGVSSPYNHGTAMAELARKANPNVKLYLVRAADSIQNPRTKQVTISIINGNNLLNALKFVEVNKEDISAVSFSYNLSGNMKVGECKLSTIGGVNVRVVEPQIRSSVVNLSSVGIPFFAATGNDGNRKPVAYPACITDTNSVAAGVGAGTIPSSNFDSNTDYVGALPANTFNYTSSIFGLLPQSTSAATVSVAAKWVSGVVKDRWVPVSR
jgi:hypothetical protein